MTRRTFERMITLPDGIMLVTGPTGSGKTTTLYSCLNYINRPDRKIITVEDPVEYQMSGINQVQVNADIGMTFPAALRSMLRQAPNIIMIGEIRDYETASIAINASLTGHLVFSTLHTNDAPGAVARLVDMGIKPFLVATSIRAIMAQRLVRKLCNNCKHPGELTEEELQALRLEPSQLDNANPMGAGGLRQFAATRATRGGHGHLRDLRDQRRGAVHDQRQALDDAAAPARARTGHADAARGRRAQGALRHDDGRGSGQRHHGGRELRKSMKEVKMQNAKVRLQGALSLPSDFCVLHFDFCTSASPFLP